MSLPALINALLSPDVYSHPVAEVRLIETHISWILLAGDYAYKIKKPVNLGFLDFSTLEKRHFFCDKEVTLNQRLEPDIYLDTLPITGSNNAPEIGGNGSVLEWTVRMRAFPSDATLDHEPEIRDEQIDAIADRIARFHLRIGRSLETTSYGTSESVMHPVRENFRQLRERVGAQADTLRKIASLEHWSTDEGTRLDVHFGQRKANGFVRDCHGDLHLGNIAWVNDAPLIFDCIEFNPALRHIDIVSEVAFLFMDLNARGHANLAWRFLNRWLEQTGDFAGLEGFRFYLVYRAVVRAKVAAIRATQGAQAEFSESMRYLELADALRQHEPAQLTLMHGHSGSGKTWVSQNLIESLGAIRLRSDVERKRLFGLDALADSRQIRGGIYNPAASKLTLDHLLNQAETLLSADFSVIVDATFLSRSWRQPFIDLAKKLGLPIHIVSMKVAPEVMRQRVAERARRSDDASEAGLDILDSQLINAEPLDETELKLTHPFNPDESTAWPQLLATYLLHF
jgi:hypothetical protein